MTDTPSFETNPNLIIEDDRTGMSPKTLQRAVLDHLFYTCGKDLPFATRDDTYRAMAHTVRDRLIHRWIQTQRAHHEADVKRAYYLSAEFLLGRALADNLHKLGLWKVAEAGLRRYDVELNDVLETEHDPGLGNGGLGRLAACFLDSMATLGVPGMGYGIRYEFGIFEQLIRDGWQLESPDAWAALGNPWEIPRHEFTQPVRFYGHVEHSRTDDGRTIARWVGGTEVLGVPYDMPIAGYGNDTVITLRLWSARASKLLDFERFNRGEYQAAVDDKVIGETISKVLYPNDVPPEGKELRLKQQYFFVACSIADILRRYKRTRKTFDDLPKKVAIQLNDTHPAIAVAELMRVLVDVEGLTWEEAWNITRQTVAYTNHTLLAEALEKWPVSLFERLLPRHLEIIYEINARFLREVHVFAKGDVGRVRRMSIVEEGGEKQIRMAHLAVVGSHSVNGVAELHSHLLRERVLKDFAELWPDRFNNKTNGVTPRRWLLSANPKLADAITARIGNGWVKDLRRLEELDAYADDAAFHEELRAIKRDNKVKLAKIIAKRCQVTVDPDSIFDIHIKRLHLYKRQLLNALHIAWLYWRLKDDPSADIVPRTFLFAGKAAPGYWMAKKIIKLVGDLGKVINDDPVMRDRIKVVFLPNYSVSLAERMFPAADVSEQISTAGKEASGTGNMKFQMNGALTVGTLDGANVEIRERVGAENFFLFGLTAEEVDALDSRGYRPSAYISESPRLRRAIESIRDGFFSPEDPGRFHDLVQELTGWDTYKHCADFDAYADAQAEVDRVYRDQTEWTRRVIKNIAHSGHFSSDRTIREYARDIWGIEPMHLSFSPKPGEGE
ncbi:MAG: glycogen/starch/alpha-glucan phosphorylase [Myxococcales bacterium]|nr:glycogen/starch/alpha-glucan phosphorylase [Myxococcales bacterium]